MSSLSLCMLVRLMIAQVQECVFERAMLNTPDTHFTSQLRLAQEAARVSDHISGRPRRHGVALLMYVCVCVCAPVGVGRLLVSAADHDTASDEGLRTVFLGVHGSGQI